GPQRPCPANGKVRPILRDVRRFAPNPQDEAAPPNVGKGLVLRAAEGGVSKHEAVLPAPPDSTYLVPRPRRAVPLTHCISRGDVMNLRSLRPAAAIAVAAAALAACASGPDPEELGRLGFMVGCWQSNPDAQGRTNKEVWSAPQSGLMFGW